jgi:hypothetical protein
MLALPKEVKKYLFLRHLMPFIARQISKMPVLQCIAVHDLH